MSITLGTAAIASFGQDVKHAYQGTAKLTGTTRVKKGVVGSTHRFNKLGKGQAQQRTSPQSSVIPMDLQHSNATATILDWVAADYTDIFKQDKVPFDEKSELATAIAKAMGRRSDQIIIDVLDGTATTLTVAKSVGGSNTNLNVDKLRRASRLLGQGGVDEGPYTYVGSHYGKEGLLGETEATSGDFAAVRALVNGEIDSFMGFKFKWIEDRDEGGLELATNDRSNYAYAMSAIGMASSRDQTMEINYVPEKLSHLCCMTFSAGAVEIDAAGVVDITTHEA